jgi:hypothetical protein
MFINPEPIVWENVSIKSKEDFTYW